jgi:hypothetical protein
MLSSCREGMFKHCIRGVNIMKMIVFYSLVHIVMFGGDYILVNRFIEHLQVVTTNSYNTIADFHTLQFTREPSLVVSVTRRFLVAVT